MLWLVSFAAVYATGLTGSKIIALRYSTRERFEVLSSLMFEICSDMEFCANEPLVRGECFSEGGEIVHMSMTNNAPTDEVLENLESKSPSSHFFLLFEGFACNRCLTSSLSRHHNLDS